MHEALHHHRKRKSSSAAHKTRLIDIVIYPIGLVGIAAATPQVYEIWFNHNVAGISVISWSMWSILSCFWVYYGAVHKERAIILINSCWFIINLSVALGAYLFG